MNKNADVRYVALTEGIAEILDVDPASLSGSFDFKSHAGWDSLAALSAMVLVEDVFKKFVDPSVFKESASLDALFDAVTAAG